MLMAASLTFVATTPAAAFQSPSPVNFPSSAYAAALKNHPMSTAADARSWSSIVKADPKGIPTKTPPLSKPGAGAGNSLLVLGTFQGSYWLTSQATSKIFDVNTSGNILCDVTLLANPASECASSYSPDEDYVLNFDWEQIPTGWTSQPVVTVSNDKGTITVGYEVVQDDAFQVVIRAKNLSCTKAGDGGVIVGSNYGTWGNSTTNQTMRLLATGALNVGNTRFLDTCIGVERDITVTKQSGAFKHFMFGVNGSGSDYSVAAGVNSQSTFIANSDVVYYTIDSPERPDGEQEPERHWRTDYECWNPVTNSVRSLTSRSDGFKETDQVWPSLPLTTCEADEVLRSSQTWQEGVGSGSKVHEYVMPSELQESYQDLPAECVDGSCILDLRKVISPSRTVSCFSVPDECVNWFTSPTRADDYQCTYNGAVLAITECTIYRPTFNPTTTTKGETLGDPVTGETPSTADPGSDLGKDPDSKTPVVPQPGGASTTRGECYPRGWSAFNPIEWVLKPMKCAFIPERGQQTLTRVKDAWTGLFVFEWLDAMRLPSVQESGCRGPGGTLAFADGFSKEVYPFSACEAPMSNVAAVTKVIAGGVAVVGGAIVCTRILGAGIGWTPGL